MDCPTTTKYQPALTGFSAPHRHRILQYLAHFAARQCTSLTLNAVVRVLPTFLRQLPKKRQVVLTADLTQTTAQDISAFITAAQAAGLAASTINTKVSLLAGFFAYLREEGQMTGPAATAPALDTHRTAQTHPRYRSGRVLSGH